MGMVQINFNEYYNRMATEKRLGRITISCPQLMVSNVDALAVRLRTDRANLCFRYIVEGLTRDIGNVLMADLNADKKLQDLLK